MRAHSTGKCLSKAKKKDEEKNSHKFYLLDDHTLDDGTWWVEKKQE
jgi:hypothetical protein